MSKGIREFAVVTFNAKLVARNNKEYANDTAFRKDVVCTIADKFNITIGAASSAYNYAKLQVTQATPELVQGLGRPEGKNNGGPKKKAPAQDAVQEAPAEELQVQEAVQEAPAEELQVQDEAGSVVAEISSSKRSGKRGGKQQQQADVVMA
jgi:hypothetical protein